MHYSDVTPILTLTGCTTLMQETDVDFEFMIDNWQENLHSLLASPYPYPYSYPY